MDYYHDNPELQAVFELINNGHFSRGDKDMFKPLVDNLLFQDRFLLLADYQSYIDCQDKVSEAYRDKDNWARMSIINTARSGKFSSDRSIQTYCDNIWDTQPVKIALEEYDQAEAVLKVEPK